LTIEQSFQMFLLGLTQLTIWARYSSILDVHVSIVTSF
jgi:hypothetical protein